MSAKLIIEISPAEPRASACLADGRECRDDPDIYRDLMDCTASGDCEDACRYILDEVGVEFRIVARNASGEFENRLASLEEMAETCRGIYFESDTDFSDQYWAQIYLVWEAANGEESNYAD